VHVHGGVELGQAGVERAGGGTAPLGRDVAIGQPAQLHQQPAGAFVIVESWCGKKVRAERIAARPGWSAVPAVRDGHIYEIKSANILQPGPAALIDGVRQLHEILG
jgi:iron complex transport system substrate-binding protein